jgi:hypothetical protein
MITVKELETLSIGKEVGEKIWFCAGKLGSHIILRISETEYSLLSSNRQEREPSILTAEEIAARFEGAKFNFKKRYFCPENQLQSKPKKFLAFLSINNGYSEDIILENYTVQEAQRIAEKWFNAEVADGEKPETIFCGYAEIIGMIRKESEEVK